MTAYRMLYKIQDTGGAGPVPTFWNRFVPFCSVHDVRSCDRTIVPKEHAQPLSWQLFLLFWYRSVQFLPVKERSFPRNDAQPLIQLATLQHTEIHYNIQDTRYMIKGYKSSQFLKCTQMRIQGGGLLGSPPPLGSVIYGIQGYTAQTAQTAYLLSQGGLRRPIFDPARHATFLQ